MTLAKGAEIVRSTHPDWQSGQTLGRTMTVTVHHVSWAAPQGCEDDFYAGKLSNEDLVLTVVWAGSGGYWREAPVSAITAVDGQPDSVA